MQQISKNNITLYCTDAHALGVPAEATAVCTDPPYGISNNVDYSRFTNGVKPSTDFSTPDKPTIVGDASPFDPAWLLSVPKVCLWGFQYYAHSLPVGSTLVWQKKRQNKWGTFLSDAELAWVKGGVGVYLHYHEWDGFLRASERGKTLHPNQKPVALWLWVFKRLKLTTDDVVFDPYAGCGSCAVACMQAGIKYIGCEIEEAYWQVACERVSQPA